MDGKVLIRELQSPDLLVEIDGNQFRLLCEFQAKDGGFQRVFLLEGGNDVVIAKGNNSAVVGLFSVEDGCAGKLFDYIEAGLDGKDGFVCRMSGEMEKQLDIAIEAGGKYPMIQAGLGLIDKAPVFYLQKRLDRELQRAVEEHTVTVEYVVDEVELDMDEEIFPYEFEEELDSEPKITQAMSLPEGWNWVDYGDLSGHLEAPDGKKWFIYDVHHDAYVEVMREEGAGWSQYPGRFEDFKLVAEKLIREHVLSDKEELVDMDKMRFYVIDNKKINFSIAPFDDVQEAIERFREACKYKNWMPVLGLQVGEGMIDLLHGVNGDAVLVPDYRYSDNFSEPMMERLEDIKAAVEWLVLEGGGISYEYQNELVPGWLQGDVTVLVPVTLGDESPNSYLRDKVLKTTNRFGLDAIDSLYLEMHGWVAYDELLRHPSEYVSDGVIKVPYLNVCYVQEKNVVGVDGQMDIAPSEFSAMVEQIKKPFALVAYDELDYDGRLEGKHEFIVASYDTIPEAVKGWYEFQEKAKDPKAIPLLVQSFEQGKPRVVFNGYDDNDKKMSYQQAVEKFGLKDGLGLTEVLEDASKRSCESGVRSVAVARVGIDK